MCFVRQQNANICIYNLGVAEYDIEEDIIYLNTFLYPKS